MLDGFSGNCILGVVTRNLSATLNDKCGKLLENGKEMSAMICLIF